MPPRAARKRKALQEVQNAGVNGLATSQDVSQAEYLDAIQDMIDNIDRAGSWSEYPRVWSRRTTLSHQLGRFT
jgi:hypothetical protein